MWNTVAAAIVLPIYFLKEWQTSSSRDNHIPANHAKVLPISALVSGIPMILSVMPPYVDRSASAQQTLLTVFVIAPLIFSATQHALASLFSFSLSRTRQEQSRSRLYTMGAYLFCALVSAGVHLYVLVTAIFSTDSAISLSRIYLPSPSRPYGSFPEKLTEGAHLFSQYDYILILLSCILYTYLILEPQLEVGRLPVKLITMLPIPPAVSACVVVTVLALLLGPSATVSLGLWARESWLESEGQSTRRPPVR